MHAIPKWAVPDSTFLSTLKKWELVPPNFKEWCIRYSWKMLLDTLLILFKFNLYMYICNRQTPGLFILNMLVCLLVFNATFNNISVISWRSVSLVEETRGPGENHWPVVSNWQTLSHNVVHLVLMENWTHNISGA
jgi:hypothetical protein